MIINKNLEFTDLKKINISSKAAIKIQLTIHRLIGSA